MNYENSLFRANEDIKRANAALKVEKVKLKFNPGFYTKSRENFFIENGIQRSFGAQNAYQGGPTYKIMNLRPHVNIFKEKIWEIPDQENSEEKAVSLHWK